MNLLHDIQAAVLEEDTGLGPIFLKLRLLAAHLGSQPLAEWVKYESDGYPIDAPLPDYRIIPVSYTASFSGPFGSGIRNAPIALYAIEKFAGVRWTRHEIRQGIAAVDDLLVSSAKGGSLCIDAANLILLLQGNVYPDYECNEVVGRLSRASLAELRHSVRSRVLELTIELGKSIPEAMTTMLRKDNEASPGSSAIATQIYNQVIYGNVMSISASGGARINVAIGECDVEGLVKSLRQAGIPEADARQLGEIVAAEEPESKQEPFGKKARKWLADNLKKAVDGTWEVGIAVATDAIKEAVLRYYGLK